MKISQPDHTSSLTEWEWHGLHNQWNLADGHAHQSLTDAQKAVVDGLPDLFVQAGDVAQQDCEDEFAKAFFHLAGQAVPAMPLGLYHYSSSISIDVAAKTAKAVGCQTVALINPTFDNIPLLLTRNGLELRALNEQSFWPELVEWFRSSATRTDAVFLVIPNNPTGFEPSAAQFQLLTRLCAEYRVLLICDFSFRFFSELPTWDQYATLAIDECERYMLIEDTGKTWPTAELKIGILTPSGPLLSATQAISHEIILNVSPIVLTMLTQFIRAEAREAVWRSQRLSQAALVVQQNRDTLRQKLEGTCLVPATPDSRISVEWLRIPAHLTSVDLATWLADNGVAVLPGPPFFWATPEIGNSYIRVALMRDPSMFADAAEALASLVLSRC